MKRNWIIGLTLALIIAGLAGYSHWRSTPTYTLSQVGKAIQTHDWELFDRYVDVNTMSRAMAGDMAKLATGVMEQQNAPKLFARGISAFMAAGMIPLFEQDIQGWITGVYPEGRQSALRSILPPVDQQTEVSLRDIQKDGERCIASFAVGDDLLLKLEMVKWDKGWQITRILNVHELLIAAKQAEAKDAGSHPES